MEPSELVTIGIDVLCFTDTGLEELGERSELYHQTAVEPKEANDSVGVDDRFLMGERLLEPVVVDHSSSRTLCKRCCIHRARQELACFVNPYLSDTGN